LNRTDFVEIARRRVRHVLGYNSWLYRNAARTLNFGVLLLSEGLGTAVQLERLKDRSANAGAPLSVKFRRLRHPISLRPGSQDIDTLINNAVRLEYGQLTLPADAPHFIVDGGAYIGDTSSFFLSQPPNATVVALEPNPESFAIASGNLAPYGERAVLLNKALADKPGTLYLSGVETGAKVGEVGMTAVECATVGDLIAMSPTGRITVLKLDIEGAEEAVFRNDAAHWLDKVDHIIVETHGPSCEAAVIETLRAARWSYRRYRNLYYGSAA